MVNCFYGEDKSQTRNDILFDHVFDTLQWLNAKLVEIVYATNGEEPSFGKRHKNKISK